jgi:hypothetical protein
MKALLFGLLVSTSTMAHLKIGVYEGVQKHDSNPCLIAVKDVKFKNDIKNPLMERVLVQTNQSLDHFTLSHLPVLDINNAKVKPHKGKLTGILVTARETQAVRLDMIHTDSYEGPGAFHYIKNKKGLDPQHVVCQNLRYLD